jgi:hypothetical protein
MYVNSSEKLESDRNVYDSDPQPCVRILFFCLSRIHVYDVLQKGAHPQHNMTKLFENV